ncbi:hypothetical protein ACHQM5_019201 [Ranunculus cassubicifolius]
MWIQRRLLLTKSLIPIRYISQSTSTIIPELPPLTYLEGFPKPDPKHNEKILAIPRLISGKNISAKERKVGRVPSILFEQENGEEGGNKRLFELEVRPDFESEEVIEKVRVLPRKLHLHAGTDAVLNVTFMRAPSSALLKVDVPLVFRGDDVCPGLRKGAYLNTIKRTVKYLCPADIVPPYIDVDLSELDVGQKIVREDLKVHPALQLLQAKDEAICNLKGARVTEVKKAK